MDDEIEDLMSLNETDDIDYASDSDNSSVDEEPDPEKTFKFDPPLYIQRYIKVCDTIKNWGPRIESLTDLGCAEFKLFQFIKRSLNFLQRINLVDVDEDLLQENLYRTLPLNVEFLNRRKHPLEVNVFVGSAGEPDPRLKQSDAVTAVEIIEHLYPDELETFTYNIFSFICPKLVIITTPNADFNVMFTEDPGKFCRHYDHKFEWSRSQFEDWANNVTLRYPNYEVSFSGIGEAPEGTENLGGCSQMALFLHKNLLTNEDRLEDLQIDSCETPFGICTYQSRSQGKHVNFHCLKEITYPYDQDTRTEDAKLMDEVRYRINSVLTFNRDMVEIDYNVFEIPLKLLQWDEKNPISEEKLEKLLRGYNYVVKKRTRSESTQTETCVVIEEEEVNDVEDSQSSEEEDAGINREVAQEDGGNVSDWDAEDEGEVETGDSCYKRALSLQQGQTPNESTVVMIQKKVVFYSIYNACNEPSSVQDDDCIVCDAGKLSDTLPQTNDNQQPCCSKIEQGPTEETIQPSEGLNRHWSMEAVVDPNSEQDSLNEFEQVTIGDNNEITPSEGQSMVYHEPRPITGLPRINLPNWSLQTNDSEEDDAPLSPPTELDPHTYCQGDGLGIHELEETDTSSETTGSIYTEAEPGPSSQDMSSLPGDDSRSNVITELMDRAQQTSSQETNTSSSFTDVGNDN